MIRKSLTLLAILTFPMASQAALAQAQDEASPADEVQLVLSPTELFGFADNARDAGDFATAEAAYRALASNPDPALRAEARFRLALMLTDQMERPGDAAVLLREILDEQPDAARVRAELARMQAMLGNFEMGT